MYFHFQFCIYCIIYSSVANDFASAYQISSNANLSALAAVMTSYRLFNMAATESQIYFWFYNWYVTPSKNVEIFSWKTIWRDISNMAEILLFLFSENKQPPYWKSTSGFNFDLSAVIGTLFCIGLPNVIPIRPFSMLLQRFSKWRSSAMLLLC